MAGRRRFTRIDMSNDDNIDMNNLANIKLIKAPSREVNHFHCHKRIILRKAIPTRTIPPLNHHLRLSLGLKCSTQHDETTASRTSFHNPTRAVSSDMQRQHM
ncbi:hypothetical protein WUBG_19030 [Wuchereria bancrofti]|uniref:Uncharacterized protein n=1 Tax=Wuchereria bancrofti TaxID=6293 RepID=J9DKT4_WUCBA|nr:hypothetical protein WUBG_19030 [Wuchereria bancrofti]